MKARTNIGWLFVMPTTIVLSFVGLIPLITVINYSFFEIFVLDARYWIGLEWYEEILGSGQFWAQQLIFDMHSPYGNPARHRHCPLHPQKSDVSWSCARGCVSAAFGAVEYDSISLAWAA